MKGIKPKVNKINPLTLKANRKLGINHRTVDTHCPYCLSRLVVENNHLKCTAEKIFMWTNDFKLFSNLEDEEQEEYLNDLDDPEKFLELYEKWECNELDCVFNMKFNQPILASKNFIVDPVAVKRVEESLGRNLTDEEKAGEMPIWTDGINYFDEYDKGLILFKMPTIVFPEEV